MISAEKVEAAERSTSAMLNGNVQKTELLRIFGEMDLTGITIEDVIGGLQAVRKRTSPIELPGDAIDCCSAGGSGLLTFNTSTFNAFLLSAAGFEVAKSGNRSASGNSGSMDVVEALGANVNLTAQQEVSVFEKLKLVFKFPKHRNPLNAQSQLAAARKEYGKLTIFNLLGSMANSVGVRKRMVGIGNSTHATLIANVEQLEDMQGKVVTGLDGLDEVTICAPTEIRDIRSGSVSVFHPEMLAIPKTRPSEIEGGSPKENAQRLLEIAKGKTSSPLVNLVLVNAAHALQICNPKMKLAKAFDFAKSTLEKGDVHEKIMRYIEVTNTLESQN